MDHPEDRLLRAAPALRLALAAFVFVWILGPYALRSAVPIWIPFAIALGLELHFFVGGIRTPERPRQRRGPQEVDLERYGYGGQADDLLLVRNGADELWIPYAGETGDELKALVAAARERAAEEAAATPAALPAQRRALGPPVRRLLTGVGVVAVLALLVWAVDTRTGWDALDAETRTEAAARFSQEASRIAEKPVTIRCDESGDYVGAVQHADGVAAVGDDFAFLTPERCLDLYRLAFKGEVRPSQTARALAVLAHEAWHLRGVRDEGTTECYALQSAVALGRRFGLPEETARQLMRQQLVENSLRSRSSPEYLVTAECRDGGTLDVDPGSSRFP